MTVLHYVGYDVDRGGILAVIRALAAENRFECLLGVNPGFRPGRSGALPLLRFPPITGDRISAGSMFRAYRVARDVRTWLRGGPGRVFHGHSRAGLLVALWLRIGGECRAVATVHCYGHQRWFYRWASRRLCGQIFWLSPAMKRHYGLPVDSIDKWTDCLPGCVPGQPALDRAHEVSRVVRLAGVGTITRWKRWHLVIDALAALPNELREKFRFHHIGGTDGSADSRAYANELHLRTAQRQLASIVEWRGEQSTSAELLAAADCLVVASECEPLSVAMLEALFAGVPVLAAASGGALDVISPPVNGWIFHGDDSTDLSRVISELAHGQSWARLRIDGEGLHRFRSAASTLRHAEIYGRLLAT